MNKQVLQFIIEENNPTGIIECSVDDWFGISYKIPRNKLKEASGLDYINNTGVYILFGDDENTAEKIAYIGEAEVFGYKLFIQLVNEIKEVDKTLHLTNNGIEYAKGMLTDEGFVVLKGSKVKEGVFESLSPSLNGFFEKERSSTDLVDNVYINDHLFSSPSMAAIAILGRNANGYTEWKNKDNVSLKKLIGGE